MKKILSVAALLLIIIAGCKKIDFADNEQTGEGLVDFGLKLPASGMEVILNSGTPDTKVNFSWNAAKPGLNTAPAYTLVMALKNGGNINEPYISFPVAGSVTAVDLTYKQLDDALKAKGIANGVKTELVWAVKADNGSVTILSQTVFNISITRMKDGASSFVLLAPESSTSPVTINPGSTSESFTFRWTKSVPAVGAPAVSYKVLFSLDGDFTNPLFSLNADAAPADTIATITYKAMSDSMTTHGLTTLATPASLRWTVVATSGNWAQQADYVNNLVIIREVKVYIVGSASPGGWDIAASTRMIEDPRFPGTYFSYIYLTGGNEIKFVNGQNWPPFPGAVDWGQAPGSPAGTLTADGESNVSVAATGVYRVTVDLANMKYYLQTATSNGIGGMGMIGNFQGWSQPAEKISYIGVNKFIYLTTMNTNDEFKFHDGNDWNNSSNSLNRWFSVDNANGGKMIVDPGSGYDNFKWTGANGRMRAIWDGSDPTNLKYSLTPATQMRVVGNGINMPGVNDWDPGSSPQMTYQGNGVWRAVLVLKANMEIKFLAGDAWGAFDYESAGNGKIQYDGGPNFNTPSVAGSYTITLDEYNGTYTIL